MSKLTKLTAEQMQTSTWSGGTTTQICIYPREAKYADRQFLWRISSATVDLAESDFTPLPDYDRYISTLQGEIELTHGQKPSIRLKPFEIHGFSGAEDTHCVGICRDFNLMLRRGAAEGSMEALMLCGERILPAGSGRGETLVYCAAGSCRVQAGDTALSLAPGEAALADNCMILRVTGENAALMICNMAETQRQK